MSRSKVGDRCTWRHRNKVRASNKHVNGEVWGRSDFLVSDSGKVYPRAGGERVGSPSNKKSAKAEATRTRRRRDKVIIINAVESGG